MVMNKFLLCSCFIIQPFTIFSKVVKVEEKKFLIISHDFSSFDKLSRSSSLLKCRMGVNFLTKQREIMFVGVCLCSGQYSRQQNYLSTCDDTYDFSLV